MHCAAELTASAPLARGGQSRLTRRMDGAPLAWRCTPDAVYLVSSAASPVGDDVVEIDLSVEAGASLTVRSAAATVAWSGTGTEQHLAARVEDGGTLDWGLEPLIATSGAHHRQRVSVRLYGSGAVRWAEEIVLGRCGEAPGHLDLRLDADLDGQPLLRHQLTLGPGVEAWDGPAVLGVHRAVGLVLAAGRDLPALSPSARARASAGAGWAILALDGPGALTIALAEDLPGLRCAMAQAEGSG